MRIKLLFPIKVVKLWTRKFCEIKSISFIIIDGNYFNKLFIGKLWFKGDNNKNKCYKWMVLERLKSSLFAAMYV